MLELLLTSPKIDINIEYKISKDTDKPYCYHVDQFEKKTPLQLAIENENVNAVRLLLSHNAIDINKMFIFKLDKRLDGFEYDEDNQGNEEEEQSGDNERDKKQRIKKAALHLAVEKGNLEIVNLLLKNKKIDINAREKFILIKPLLKIDLQKNALQIAIEEKEIEIVKLLINQRSISINERTPYKFDREAKTCTFYDDDGNEIDMTEKNKKAIKHVDCLRTPLHMAVQTGCIEIIKLLLEHKSIDIQIDDGQGKLPIDYTDNSETKELLTKTK